MDSPQLQVKPVELSLLIAHLLHQLLVFLDVERSQSQDPVPYRFIEKVWYDIYHIFVSYQLTRNSR